MLPLLAPHPTQEAPVFTATKDLMLPATVTGSWPRPRWYTENMWGRPLDYGDDEPLVPRAVHATPTPSSSRIRSGSGLDILTTGDYHLDEDVAGRSWHHYPLQRWKGLEHEELQTQQHPLACSPIRSARCSTRSTRRGAGRASSSKVEARPEEPARVRQDLADRAAERGVRQAGQVRHVLGAGAGVLPRQSHDRRTTSTTRSS